MYPAYFLVKNAIKKYTKKNVYEQVYTFPGSKEHSLIFRT